MKKQLLKNIFLLMVFMTFLGCSGDDANNVDPVSEEPQILIKKITETIYYSGESEVWTTDFVYKNNQLISSSTSYTGSATIYKTNFSYDGEKVLETIHYNNDVERSRNTYVYTGNNLMQIVSNRTDQSRTDFSYTNGVVTTKETGYVNNGSYTVNHTESYIYNSGNRTEEQVVSSQFGTPENSKTVYAFDAKNNPTKFMNKYLRHQFSAEGFDGLSQNNMISRLSYWPTDTTTPKLYTYELVYDANNFPTEIKQFSPEGTVITLTKIEYQ